MGKHTHTSGLYEWGLLRNQEVNSEGHEKIKKSTVECMYTLLSKSSSKVLVQKSSEFQMVNFRWYLHLDTLNNIKHSPFWIMMPLPLLCWVLVGDITD